MLFEIVRDVRFAFRSLVKSPLLTGVAVVSLALGIGANTAIFTLFDQVLLRMLPVEDPASLVQVATRGSHSGSNRGRNAISYPMYKDYRERNKVFDGILCRRGVVVNLGFGNATERAEAELVSGNYFEVLGVTPALGRVFSLDDERAPGADAVVVLNYDYWRQRFAADEGVIGEAIRVNGHPMTVVGVAVALPSAWWLGKLLESQLYGVTPRDPVTMAVSALLLFAVTILAGAVPAARASRLSPTTVLRYE